VGSVYYWRIKGLDLVTGRTYPWINSVPRDVWRVTEITTCMYNLWEYLEPSEGGVAATCLSLGGRVLWYKQLDYILLVHRVGRAAIFRCTRTCKRIF
jgi:hypothetical protein